MRQSDLRAALKILESGEPLPGQYRLMMALSCAYELGTEEPEPIGHGVRHVLVGDGMPDGGYDYIYARRFVWDDDAAPTAFLLDYPVPNPHGATERGRILKCVEEAAEHGAGGACIVYVLGKPMIDREGLKADVNVLRGSGRDAAFKDVLWDADVIVAAWGGHPVVCAEGTRMIRQFARSQELRCYGCWGKNEPRTPDQWMTQSMDFKVEP